MHELGKSAIDRARYTLFAPVIAWGLFTTFHWLWKRVDLMRTSPESLLMVADLLTDR